ncbi:c-type cytochrome [Candidatus Nitronereus thalassa]|uniref:C-type cytochrome n=1 Tax=Candidatus Nitronereus thalassa TaxID=3020898 RepID=A0ABU3K7J2_9BACT|nr:c-type cytochrome [Candidatus Nitronereus thalassa]MDT7042376.1 c-type cytochrome [Candidatus Nitronereus thalassa]
MQIFVIIALMVLGFSVSVDAFNKKERQSTITFPLDPITFQSAPGSQIATSYCLICHSAEYVYMQPPHPRERWEEIVLKMKQVFGCPIPESDIPALSTYLVSQNKIQPRVELKKVKAEPALEAVQESPSSSGNASSGKRVFGTYCVNCHGQLGKGDGPIGQSLVPPAANLTLLGKKSDNEILDAIRKGRPGTAMPSWKNDLSTQDILDVLAYIRTLAL